MPEEYREVAIMAATGWTWGELMDTPHDIIHKLNIYNAVKSAVETKKSLKVDEETGAIKVQ